MQTPEEEVTAPHKRTWNSKVTAITTVCPYAGRLRFLPSPKTQIKLCSTLEMPDCCLRGCTVRCARAVRKVVFLITELHNTSSVTQSKSP